MTNTGMDEPQSFAVLLRRYRVAARLTQAELAERAAMSARAITDLERGVRRFPYPDTVDRLARALDLGAADREGLFRARRPRDTGAIGQDVPPNTGPSRAPAQPPNAVSGGEERKLVTVLFGQLVNSSAGVDELDPEDARDLLARYHVRIRADLERFGGTVDKFIGQQLVAFFGAPAAHEDDPERAVRAALAVRDWMLDEATGVRARIGVASGEALVSSGALTSLEAPIAVGEVINVADGLRLAAPLDGVLVDEPTFRRTRDAIEYRGAETVTPRVRSAALTVWEAMRPLAQPGVDHARHRAPFIGRERELGAVRERLAWAASVVAPQFVTIVGVPGIGKTRLVAELRRAAAGAGDPVIWRQGRSLPYGGGLSFWALGEIVKAEAAILESDPPDLVERKLGKAVARIVEDHAEARRIATSLGPLIGLRGRDAALAGPRRETFASWRVFLEALAQERTLVLVFEDLHWAEDGLLDFIDELVERASGVRLLVVATARPELLDRRPSWAGGKANALTLSLPPLTRADTAQLVTAILDRPVLQREVEEEALLVRVGGNPLYAEQFCRILLEHGRLADLPQTIHGIIAARLDLLTHLEKRLLQDAAVVGRVFWIGALEAIGGVSRPEADELLHGLARRQFVQRSQRSSVAGDVEYVFAHELLREVAYAEIPRAARGDRHRRAAEWIDGLGRSEDHAELLAHHYLATLEYARNQSEDMVAIVQRTVDALRGAGLRAMRLSANQRAVDHFSRAIGLLEQLAAAEERGRNEAELQLRLGMALFALQGFGAPEVERAYGRATELMMASVPTAEQFPLHFGLSIFHGHRGNFEHSQSLVDRMTHMASEGEDTMRLQALHARWMNSLFGGHIDDAIVAAAAGRAIYRSEVHHATGFLYGNHDPGVCALALPALALAYRGDSHAAVMQVHAAIALARRLGHGVSLAQSLTQLPWAHQINGDPTAALREAEQALELEERVAHPQFFGIARAMRGWALASTGRTAEGVAELERALADELLASTIWAAMIGTLLAEVQLHAGRHAIARALLDQVKSLTAPMPAYYYQPEIQRVEAAWLCTAGRHAEARSLLIAAIGTARQHGSLALAIRSALALARADS
ncbi:MAG TPA: AAA family ATPase, partial [Chloroflexota bacterium]|nr:AAA family ATPase [Chloroflexota bacterium]